MTRSREESQSFVRAGDLAHQIADIALVRGGGSPSWLASNWTKHPNALLDVMIVSEDITLAELKMLCYTLRETVGWIDRNEGRRQWTLPITQQELADVLGVGRTSLAAAIKRLTAKSVIFFKKKPHTTERSYQINQEWVAQIECSLYASRESPANVPEAGRPCSSVNHASPETEQTTQRILARINALHSNKETR